MEWLQRLSGARPWNERERVLVREQIHSSFANVLTFIAVAGVPGVDLAIGVEGFLTGVIGARVGVFTLLLLVFSLSED